VLFPAAREKMAAESAPAKKDDLTGSGLILLVDDEELVRGAASAMLSFLGYTVIEASNGQEAIELFQRNSSRIQLALIDLSMPVMNGEECLKHLKSMRPDLPVVLSSGYSETEAARRLQTAGLATFLQKPYTAQHLAELVKGALRTKGGILDRVA
jgi:CheY-like chemotaxis protein